MEACFYHEIKNKKRQLFIYNSELISHNSISLVSIKSESQKLVRYKVGILRYIALQRKKWEW